MSRLQIDRLSVALCPAQVGVEHVEIGWRRKETHQSLIGVGPHEAGKSTWQGALGGLSGWLEGKTFRFGAVTLVLSNRFARFALVPWADAVSSPQEEMELAQACFEPRYGDMAGWTVRIDGGRYGEPRIACAVETALLDGAREVVERHKLRCSGVYPSFTAGWNRFGSELGKSAGQGDGIFAMIESGTLVVATRHAGSWRSLRSMAAPSNARSGLELIEREALLQGFAELPPAWVSMPGMAKVDADAGEAWKGNLHVLGSADAGKTALALARLGGGR